MPSSAIVDVANRKTSDQVSENVIGKDSGNIEPFTASAILLPNRVVKFDTAVGAVTGSVLAADLHAGVYVGYLNAAIGELAPIAVDGVCLVELGGTVTQGQMLSTDTVGRAVTAATTNRLIGKALQSGTIGQKVKVLLSDHSLVV